MLGLKILKSLVSAAVGALLAAVGLNAKTATAPLPVAKPALAMASQVQQPAVISPIIIQPVTYVYRTAPEPPVAKKVTAHHSSRHRVTNRKRGVDFKLSCNPISEQLETIERYAGEWRARTKAIERKGEAWLDLSAEAASNSSDDMSPSLFGNGSHLVRVTVSREPSAGSCAPGAGVSLRFGGSDR